MRILRLETVDAFIAFDLDDASVSAGGTRLAPDVTEGEAALLARAMTYKFAVLGQRTGGAKGAVRATPETRNDAMARYVAEIRPLVESRRFLTSSDLGTSEADFAPLRDLDGDAGPMSAVIDGVAMEDLVTGYGVATAAETALGGLDGRSVAIEGFGKVGGGAAREVARRGGRVVAVSTLAGCVFDERGLDVERLRELRAAHGDRLVEHLDRPVRPPLDLFATPADVLVPGARTGVIDAGVAAGISASAITPAANVPYTTAGLAALRERGVAVHADFVCNAGAVIGFTTRATTTDEIFGAVERRIRDLVSRCRDEGPDPFATAQRLAEEFLRTWRDHRMPDGPALAPDGRGARS